MKSFRLTEHERRAWREDGFTQRERAFAESEVEALRDAAEAVVGRARAATPGSEHYAIDGNVYHEAAGSTIQLEHAQGRDTLRVVEPFHHLDPREKDFAISSKLSWTVVVEELKKCVLLCSNCHREAHDGWHPDLLTLDEGGKDYGEDFLVFDEDEDTDVTPRPSFES